jgi:hypothetical protein
MISRPSTCHAASTCGVAQVSAREASRRWENETLRFTQGDMALFSPQGAFRFGGNGVEALADWPGLTRK